MIITDLRAAVVVGWITTDYDIAPRRSVVRSGISFSLAQMKNGQSLGINRARARARHNSQ